MTQIEHYLSTRIQTMVAMLDVAAKRLRAAGDDWAAGECEREAQHARGSLGIARGEKAAAVEHD